MQNRRNQARATELPLSSARRQRDGGYLLLAILLMMALMIIAATIVAPRVLQQIKRDREEEMIHRGTEYARAIKKFYKKNGRYPATLDDLDKGQLRYLRKRYKDPLVKDGKWKLLNYGDIQSLLTSAGPGTPAAALASPGGGQAAGGTAFPGGAASTPGSLAFGVQQQQQAVQQQQQPGSINSGFPVNSGQGNSESFPSNNFGSNNSSGNNQSATAASGFGTLGGSSAVGNSGAQQAGTAFGQNSAGGTQTFGGGAVVGVASMDRERTIRIYNKKKTYNEWQFIYNPIMDRANVLLRGPYQPTTIGGAQVGTPAGQMNGQQQSGSGFGQQNSFGQQQNGYGQQQNGFGQQQNGFGQQQNASPPSGQQNQQQ